MSALTEVKLPEISTKLPGPRAQALLEKDKQFISPSYTRSYPLVVDRGYGAMIEDVDGNIFLDFNAGVAVAALGYANPEIADVIAKQARRFVHISGTDYYYPHQTLLAEKLVQLTPGSFPKKVHYGNSGAEAIEGALKAAFYTTGRSKIIAFRGAFHGRTFGALSLTSSKAAQRKGFGSQALDVTHIPYADALRFPLTRRNGEGIGKRIGRYIEETIFTTTVPPSECAAIVVEPVMGEGGYIVPTQDFFPELRRIADKHGILLIVDEVQSGMGRTGKLWAIEHFDAVPDIICMAKAVGGGLPLGITLARADCMDWGPGAHASTFGGNPVAIAAALKTLELLENGVLDNCRIVGAYLKESLTEVMERHANIAEVRGLGLMIGIEIVKDRATLAPWPELRDQVVQECFQRGLVIQGAGQSSIRLSPPLIIDEEQVDFAVRTIDTALTKATR
ncbi:MAG TPA: acetyl ornithine aminotransferase family protein [Blastocatellia bacterium]|nr:acetyl ornithine aminotransferase family protein [Blastocatellia bacterium]